MNINGVPITTCSDEELRVTLNVLTQDFNADAYASARAIERELERRSGASTPEQDLLRPPCKWCGYNGVGYWQPSTHDPSCRWFAVGGEPNRRALLAASPSPPVTQEPAPDPILTTDDYYALLRILEVLPIADPFITALQSKLSDDERRQHGNRVSRLSGSAFVREIERIESLIQSRVVTTQEQPLSARWQELFWALPPGEMRSKLRALEMDMGNALRSVSTSAPLAPPETCAWRDEGWERVTGCGHRSSMLPSDPTRASIGWKGCPYCLRPLSLSSGWTPNTKEPT